MLRIDLVKRSSTGVPRTTGPTLVTGAVYGAPRTRHDTTVTATIDITARATRHDDVTPGMHTPRP